MRILLLIFGCLALLGCQPNQQGDHNQGSLKTDKHKAVLEKAEKEPLISAQPPAFTKRGYAYQSHSICRKPQQLQASHARWFCEAVDENKPKSAGGP